jgi:hypothetical protein
MEITLKSINLLSPELVLCANKLAIWLRIAVIRRKPSGSEIVEGKMSVETVESGVEGAASVIRASAAMSAVQAVTGARRVAETRVGRGAVIEIIAQTEQVSRSPRPKDTIRHG